MLSPHRISALVTVLMALAPPCQSPSAAAHEPRDLVIYGGSSAAVMAAVQATRMGKSVVVISPDRHLGGLSSGGLGWTDTGNKAVIGGLARDFYHRVWQHYERPEAWRWQARAGYGNRGQGHAASDGERRTMWVFEPHVAERIFEDLVAEHGIEVVRDEWLDRERGVRKEGERIVSITTLAGHTYPGKMFIDATYEGDLMAAAGVTYHVGREARRMVGAFVMTENELRKKKPTPHPVGMGSYTIDSHNVQRYVTPEGFVQNEGDVGVSTGGPYEIAYGSLVPKQRQCDNLLVPVAVSASHIAYGSIRMEPVFMILGQSAATAAALAIDGGTSVQDVSYDRLRERLLADGQVLSWTKPTAAETRGR